MNESYLTSSLGQDKLFKFSCSDLVYTKYIYIQQNVNRRITFFCYTCRNLYLCKSYLLESCHRLYFSVEESYVYYEFVRLYLL